MEPLTLRLVSFQHPIPKTIRGVKISTVCAAHDHFRTDTLPADPYGGAPGYLNPIPASPTEAERLYVRLYRYTGQTFRPDTCGCRIAMCLDRFDVEPEKVHKHPKHTHKCSAHETDDDQHTAAREENKRVSIALAKVRERFKDLTDEDVQWGFDAARVLRVTAPKLKANEKAQAQLDHDPAKVIIE